VRRVASFRKLRCLVGVGPTPGDTRRLAVVESVRCLECGAVYAKPFGGGTVRENPGCPDCGYVGWMSTPPATLTAALQPSRFAAGRPHYHSG
jgi:hypothetical protein